MTTSTVRRAVTTLGPPVDVEHAPRWTRDHHPWIIPGTDIRYSPSEVREYDDLTKPMQWHRTAAAIGCGWYAEDDVNRYLIERIGHKSWTLRIFRLAVTAGVRHIVGVTAHEQTFADLKSIAVDIAEAYRALGGAYRPAEHGHRNRMTEAIGRAYAEPEPESLPESACEGCGGPVTVGTDNDKCDGCTVATECEHCAADVGTVEIGRNGGMCDDCADTLDDAPEWTLS